MKPLSVVFLDSRPGSYGSERHCAELAIRLGQKGHRVSAIVKPKDWLEQTLSRAGIPVEAFKLKPWSPVSLYKMIAFCKRHKPDVLHTHSPGAMKMAIFISKLLKIPLVATAHSPDVQRLYLWASRAKGRLVAVSHRVREALISLGVPNEAITVIYPGVPETEREPEPRSEAVRAKLGVSPNRFAFALVGRFRGHKGQDIATQALAQLPQDLRERAHLVLIGDGPQELLDEIRDLAKELGVSGHVTFAGVLEDVPGALCSLDALLLPSMSEGMPACVLEAMCMQKPVVTTTAGDLALLIESGKNGFLADRTPEAFEKVMERLMRDPELCARIGNQARIDAVAGFTSDRMASQNEALYQTLLGRDS